MGNLAASAVTVNRAWTEGGVTGKDHVCRDVTLVLTGQGGATNKIPASALGLDSILESSNAIADGNDHIYCAAPAYDGSFLALKASATDALADITDTVRLIVKGNPHT